MPSLHAQGNLFDYFRDRVEDAHAKAGARLSADTVLYLTNLLVERARTDRPTLPEQTLAELHGRAAHAEPGKQVAAYRELGDRSLYLVGCFQESLARRAVGPGYYADMGAAAYWKVDQGVKRWFADAFGPVFRELAVAFGDCVDILGHVRAAHLRDDADNLMGLYQRWRESPSEALERRMMARGAVLLRSAEA